MPNKEQNQKNPSKSYCGKCGKERAPIKMCRCAGGGSGSSGGGSGGGDSETKEKDNLNSNSQITSAFNQVVGTSTKMSDKSAWIQSQLCSDNKIINYETGSLLITSDGFGGNLTFRVKPGLSKDDIKASQAFLTAVQTEFNKFKELLEDKNISTTNFTATRKNNELIIHIPKPHYVAFIKHLENKNLLPVPNPERDENKESLRSAKEDKKQAFNLNPFSTRLEKK